MSPNRDAEIVYSVVVPVFNSENTLRELTGRVHAALTGFNAAYEIILVDDGSRDGSWRMLESLRHLDDKIKIIQLMRNFGQHCALLCGLKHANGQYVICLDDDLQDRPEDIPRLIHAINVSPEADVVIASTHKKHGSFLRNLASFLIHATERALFKIHGKLEISNFLIMRRSVLTQVLRNRSKGILVVESILQITDRIINISVDRQPRREGKSGYTLNKLFSIALDAILFHSNFPLMLVSYLGFFSALASFFLIIYYLCRYVIVGIGVSGWITLVILTLFFPGMVLLSFGILGQYLLRIAREVNRSSQYIVRMRRGFEDR